MTPDTNLPQPQRPVSELLRKESWRVTNTIHPCYRNGAGKHFPEAVRLLERELKAYDDLREDLGGKEGPECAEIRAYLAKLRKEVGS